jgi:hypothetical protein
MQQPKNEPNANPIRTLKKSRVISTGKLSKIRLNRRPQRGFTEGHRDHKGRIQKAKTGDCRAAAIRNQSCIAVGYTRCRTGTKTNISRKNKTGQASRRYQFCSRLTDPAFAKSVSYRPFHYSPEQFLSVTSVTSCSSSFSANLCSIVPGWRPDGRTRLRLIHA